MMSARRMLFAIAAASLLTRPVAAQDIQVRSSLNYELDSWDGETLTRVIEAPLVASGRLNGWDVDAAISWQRYVGRGDVRLGARDDREFARVERDSGRASGVTDLEINAQRSIAFNNNLSLDLLGRLTLPTGSQRKGLGTGRVQAMMDVGLSFESDGWLVWGGTARRFRTSSAYFSGRDIWEAYAGAERTLGHGRSVRAEYLVQQGAYRGDPVETTATVSFSQTVGPRASLEAYTTRETGWSGTEWFGGLRLAWQLDLR